MLNKCNNAEKNPNPKRHKIAAQAISEEPAHTKDQKAWPKAGMKGWCVGGIVVLQLGLCLVAMHLICWQLMSCQYFHAQECENLFATKFQRICHQGQIERGEATVIQYITNEQPKNSVIHTNFNVCLQRCSTAIARKGISWQLWEKTNKSQKPSKVNGVLPKLDNHVKINSKTMGLITPKVNANDNRQRCGNMCSMASQLRRNRQVHLENKRLLARNDNRNRSLAKEEIEASLRHLQRIYSSSSSGSSSDDEDKGDASSKYTSTSTKDKLREEKGKQNGDLTCARGTSTNGKHGDLTCKSGTSTNGNNRDVEIQTAGTRAEDNRNGKHVDGHNHHKPEVLVPPSRFVPTQNARHADDRQSKANRTKSGQNPKPFQPRNVHPVKGRSPGSGGPNAKCGGSRSMYARGGKFIWRDEDAGENLDSMGAAIYDN